MPVALIPPGIADVATILPASYIILVNSSYSGLDPNKVVACLSDQLTSIWPSLSAPINLSAWPVMRGNSTVAPSPSPLKSAFILL